MRGPKALAGGFLGIVFALVGATASAAELLAGQVELDDGRVVAFSLSAANREKVVGGEIRLDDRSFQVTGESRLGLIGAKRTLEGDSPSGEFVVFSSSFSEQTAVGQPWVKAEHYRNCDQRYNSFLAIYRIEDPTRALELGETPYPILVDDLGKSDHSEVFCFVSKPPS
jgi:hypothetical protein